MSSPYTITLQGIEIRCETADDVLALISRSKREVVVAGTQEIGASIPSYVPSYAAPARNNRLVAATVISTLTEGGRKGVGAEELAAGLGLKSSRGLGAVLPLVKREVQAVGFSPDEVLGRVLGADGRPVWKALDRAGEALAALRSAGTHQGSHG